MLVFANFFTANAHYRQTGPLDLYCDTTTDNLLELEHRTQALQNSAVELRKLATANKALHLVFTQMSELNHNDLRRRITLAHIDVF